MLHLDIDALSELGLAGNIGRIEIGKKQSARSGKRPLQSKDTVNWKRSLNRKDGHDLSCPYGNYAERLADAGAVAGAVILGEVRMEMGLSLGIRPRRAACTKYSLRPLRFSGSRE